MTGSPILTKWLGMVCANPLHRSGRGSSSGSPRTGGVGSSSALVSSALILLSLLTLSACRNSATWSVAVGARGALSTMYGPCTPTTTDPTTTDPVRFTSELRYEAVSAGTARLRCRDGDVVLEVREPARVSIDTVARARVGQRLFYRAAVHDTAGHELDVGEERVLSWAFSGALAARASPGCGDIIPTCPSANAGFARAEAPGLGTIDVSFRGLRATSTTHVTAP